MLQPSKTSCLQLLQGVSPWLCPVACNPYRAFSLSIFPSTEDVFPDLRGLKDEDSILRLNEKLQLLWNNFKAKLTRSPRAPEPLNKPLILGSTSPDSGCLHQPGLPSAVPAFFLVNKYLVPSVKAFPPSKTVVLNLWVAIS